MYRQTPPGFGSVVDERDLHSEVSREEGGGVATGASADYCDV